MDDKITIEEIEDVLIRFLRESNDLSQTKGIERLNDALCHIFEALKNVQRFKELEVYKHRQSHGKFEKLLNAIFSSFSLLYHKDNVSLHTMSQEQICELYDITKTFLHCVSNLMVSSAQKLNSATAQTNELGAVIQCVTSCLRLCRNLCAITKSNQSVLHESETFIYNLKTFLSILKTKDCLTEDIVVLIRCSIQFLCNYASGNTENQQQVWTMFLDFFMYCLNSKDEKLQSYTQIGVHMCLSNQSIRQSSQPACCWDVLQKCVYLAVKEEAVNGLLVIEDALKLPGFREHVYARLDDQLRILVLEVLINQIQQIPDGSARSDQGTLDYPCMNLIEYLAADFVVQSHHIPSMSRNSLSDSKALCIVKELEALCLASVHHSLYPCLQEMTQLVKVSIALLQSIEDLGHEGNPMFTNADRMSDLDHVNQDHPVFGLKRDLIRLLGNLAYKHKANQDLIREQNGIPLILNKTNIDGKNPFIIQWSVLAIHNLTEDNIENKQYIADLKLEGVANNQAVLEEMGLTAERDGEKIVVKKKRLS